jgi:hypothetical protein
MPHYTGGCLCGAVRIEIDAAPYRVGLCHCLDCRKRHGAIFSSFAVFPADVVQVRGETREFKTRSFCPTCGSPLFDRVGDEFELQVGCLDEPNLLAPTYESWVVRRECWLPPFDVQHHYDRDRLTTGRSDS